MQLLPHPFHNVTVSNVIYRSNEEAVILVKILKGCLQGIAILISRRVFINWRPMIQVSLLF